MSEDSVKQFMADLTPLSLSDICESYAYALWADWEKTGLYCIDDKSGTMFGLINGADNNLWAVRFEHKGHKCSKRLISLINRKLDEWTDEQKRPVLIKISKTFYTAKCLKLLRLCGFKFKQEVKDFYIYERRI